MTHPTGYPQFFSLDNYYTLVKQYVSADEVERALWLLDNPPAYFRDNPPKELLELKERLHRALWTPAQYRGIYEGVSDSSHWPHRAEVLCEVFQQWREEGWHLMEIAPGSHWLRDGLKKRNFDFTYEYIGLDRSEFCESSEFNAQIFVAFEIIEHLANPWEIYQNYLKFGKTADTVVISTPLYTYAGGMHPDDLNRPMGHLRAYTPRELHKCVSEMFQGYEWTCHLADTITLVGNKA
jgi:hypothetical protein